MPAGTLVTTPVPVPTTTTCEPEAEIGDGDGDGDADGDGEGSGDGGKLARTVIGREHSSDLICRSSPAPSR